ncbi:MAG: M20/M25/M40 family metallo-hydrolase, partial [Planctomycetota bacterium]
MRTLEVERSSLRLALEVLEPRVLLNVAVIQTIVDGMLDPANSNIADWIDALDSAGAATPDGIGSRNSYNDGTYYWHSGNLEAREMIRALFESWGLTVTMEEFELPTPDLMDIVPAYNVVGELTGTNPDAPIYYVTCHYDSTAIGPEDVVEATVDTVLGFLQPEDEAPGADDNASGTAAMMEVARALATSGVRFESTIRFVAFGSEEIGLVGSDAHTKELYYDIEWVMDYYYDENGDPIDTNGDGLINDEDKWPQEQLTPNPQNVGAAINLDMVAYASQMRNSNGVMQVVSYEGNTFDITQHPFILEYIEEQTGGDPFMTELILEYLQEAFPPPVADSLDCAWLADVLAQAGVDYNTGLEIDMVYGNDGDGTDAADWWELGASDHFNFWWYGWDALLLIDGLDPATGEPYYPYYHSTDDVFENLNAEGLLMAKSASATVAALVAELASPILLPVGSDFNGDGAEDLWRMDGLGRWLVTTSQGSTEVWGAWSTGVTWEDVRAADFTGDGKADIVGRTDGGEWWLAVSTGTGLTNEFWGAWAPINWNDVQAGDFTGDGKADITGRTDAGQWWIAVSTGSAFVNEYWGAWAPINWNDVQAGDLNGDGKTDIVGRTDDGQWWAAVSTGSAFTNELWGAWAAIQWDDVRVGDFNGDGRTDVVARTDYGQWWVAVSSGSAFTNELWGAWSTGVTWSDVRVGDFNDDGNSDL